MVVDLPAPFGPRKPVDDPGLHDKAQIVNGDFVTESLGEASGLDHDVPLCRRSLLQALLAGSIWNHRTRWVQWNKRGQTPERTLNTQA